MNLYLSNFCERTNFEMPFKLKDSLDYFPLGLNQKTIATIILNNFPWKLSNIHFVVLCSPILIPNTIEIDKLTPIETCIQIFGVTKWTCFTTTRIQSTNTQWKEENLKSFVPPTCTLESHDTKDETPIWAILNINPSNIKWVTICFNDTNVVLQCFGYFQNVKVFINISTIFPQSYGLQKNCVKIFTHSNHMTSNIFVFILGSNI